MPPDLLVVTSEDHTSVLRGRLLPRLAPWIDGAHTLEQLALRLGAPATVVDVRFGLELLAEEGLLVEAGAGGETPPWVATAADPAAAPTLPPLAVAVEAIAPLDASLFAERLAHHPGFAGCQLTNKEVADLTIVLTEDYHHRALVKVDRRARRVKRRWLAVKPVGPLLMVAPSWTAGATGCWHCLRHRLEQNRPGRAWIDQVGTTLQRPRFESSPATLQWAVQATVDGLARWVNGSRLDSAGAELLTLDTTTLETRLHRIVPWPSCPVCGHQPPPRQPLPAPVKLEPVPLATTRDGGFRAHRPEETLQRLHHHVSPLTGIVGRLRPHSLGAMQVFIADHLFRHEPDEHEALAAGKYQLSAGKGISAAQARASALCEALERYSGMIRDNDPRRTACWNNLGDEAIRPNDCMLYSPRQLRQRDRWNGLGQRYMWVPQPFDDQRQLEWSPLWSLTHQRFRYLPTAYCYYNVPLPDDFQICLADSNGCAAGSCREEAILQGFLELAERDAVALWWYHRLRRPEVDLTSFDAPFFEQLAALYSGLERTLCVLDITNDLALPAFVAVSRSTQGEVLLGFGCHLDASIAIARALTEVNQFLPGSIDGRKRQLFSQPLTSTDFLQGDPQAAARRRDDYPSAPHQELSQAVRHCVKRAAKLGLETLVLDQTRSDVGLCVVRVVVPGLRHFWARLGPGRLYEAPLRLHWVPREANESSLNPAHLLI